jgi:hypothetical protein
MLKNLRILLTIAIMTISSAAMASDTNYDFIKEVKAFTSSGGYFNLLMTNEANTCGGSSNKNYFLALTDTELIRLAETSWFAGRQVRLEYSCATIARATNAKVTGVRAK